MNVGMEQVFSLRVKSKVSFNIVREILLIPTYQLNIVKRK